MTPEEFINPIIEAIKKAEENTNNNMFMMSVWAEPSPLENEQFECGTAACIAGWTVEVHEPTAVIRRSDGAPSRSNTGNIDKAATKLFTNVFPDIFRFSSSDDLFLPGCADGVPSSIGMSGIKAGTAIAVLEGIRDTGEINWKKALLATKELYTEEQQEMINYYATGNMFA